MMSVTPALVPVFVVIVIGFALRASKLVEADHWVSINHLCYYVLFPILIIKSLGTADLSSTPVTRIAGAMIMAIGVMSALLLLSKTILSRLLDLSDAAFSSLFQGSTRWHGFVALAIIAALFGDQGLVIGSIGLAVMIPTLNIVNVTVLNLYGEKTNAVQPNLIRLWSRNPFIIACFIGTALNLAPLHIPTAALATLDLIGRAALGISLLTVGAALTPASMFDKFPVVLSTAVLRLLGMPTLMLVSCLAIGVRGNALIIAVICAAVPTASSGYVLAKKMGGDAELLASIITFQVLAAMFTLPLVISIAASITN